jgi:hypothetical protein
MAWNEARVSLSPAGTRPTITIDRSASSGDRSPVSVVGAAPATHEAPTAPINAQALRDWFVSQGFVVVTASAAAIVLKHADTEAFVAVSDAWATEVILTFTLDGEALSRLRSWKEFVTQLHHEWDLQLVDPRVTATVDLGEFQRLVTASQAWRDMEFALQGTTASRYPGHPPQDSSLTNGPTLDVVVEPPLPSAEGETA